MILPILHWPDPRLKTSCDQVEVFDPALLQQARDMLDTMYAAEGRGLAAPQVGIMRRIFVMDAGWKVGKPDPRMFFNPSIVTKQPMDGWIAPTGVAVNTEACLSIPGRAVRIARPAQVRLNWQDNSGRDCQGDFTGFEAVCVQHEIDHLNGILCIDHPEIAEEPAR